MAIELFFFFLFFAPSADVLPSFTEYGRRGEIDASLLNSDRVTEFYRVLLRRFHGGSTRAGPTLPGFYRVLSGFYRFFFRFFPVYKRRGGHCGPMEGKELSDEVLLVMFGHDASTGRAAASAPYLVVNRVFLFRAPLSLSLPQCSSNLVQSRKKTKPPRCPCAF